MDIVANIPQENDNKNQTNQLLVEQFKHFNIEIYGTYEEPLFKAKDIGDLLNIKNIRQTLTNFDKDEVCNTYVTDSSGRNQEMNMLTEQGLYKMLMISRKPIAKEFQKWVFNIVKQIRLNSNNKLENKIKELEFYKEPSYKELPLEETVYCNTTDIEGIYKVGETGSTSKKRRGASQTPCVIDIKTLYEVKTINSKVLEDVVHLALHRYRVSKREHFECNLEHIKFVMDKCAKFVNTIACVRKSITPKEFTEKLGTKIVSDKIVEKEQIVKKVVYKTKYIQNDLSDFDLDELLSIDEPKNLIQELN
jgi:prophage antirepressor-like protein